jgi:hypothetical protein
MPNLQLCQHEQFILASPYPPLPCRRANSRSRGSDLEGGYVFVSTRLKILFKKGGCGTFDPLFLNLIVSMCRRFETGGSPSRRVSVLRAPAQMGRARGRARRGERRGGRSRA